MSAVSPGLGVLILGNSIFEGVGTALLIPPVYILTTMLFTDVTSRAARLRLDQRDGRRRRRRRAADRRPHHHGHQLASGVRVPGAGHRRDFRARPPHRRSGGAGSDPPLRHRRRDPVRRRPRHPGDGHPRGGQQPPAHADPARRCSPGPRRVLRPCPRHGARPQGTPAVDRAVPKPDVEPRPRHAERSVARAARHLVHRVRLSASGSRIQRDRDRCDLHGRHRRHPGLVARGRTACQEVRAADADHGRFRRHDRRDRRAARAGGRVAQRVGLRALVCCSSGSASA